MSTEESRHKSPHAQSEQSQKDGAPRLQKEQDTPPRRKPLPFDDIPVSESSSGGPDSGGNNTFT